MIDNDQQYITPRGNAAGQREADEMTLVNRTELKKQLGGISTATVDRWERRGVIPRAIRRPGMLPRWVLEDVLEALGLSGNEALQK